MTSQNASDLRVSYMVRQEQEKLRLLIVLLHPFCWHANQGCSLCAAALSQPIVPLTRKLLMSF